MSQASIDFLLVSHHQKWLTRNFDKKPLVCVGASLFFIFIFGKFFFLCLSQIHLACAVSTRHNRLCCDVTDPVAKHRSRLDNKQEYALTRFKVEIDLFSSSSDIRAQKIASELYDPWPTIEEMLLWALGPTWLVRHFRSMIFFRGMLPCRAREWERQLMRDEKYRVKLQLNLRNFQDTFDFRHVQNCVSRI